MHDRELLQVAQRSGTLAERIERARDARFLPVPPAPANPEVPRT